MLDGSHSREASFSFLHLLIYRLLFSSLHSLDDFILILSQELDCVWSAWSPWAACSHTCGPSGTRSRFRSVEEPARPGGLACPADGFLETQSCPPPDNLPCPCRLSAWTEWSECSQDCGGGGWRSRTRKSLACELTETDNAEVRQVEECNMDPCLKTITTASIRSTVTTTSSELNVGLITTSPVANITSSSTSSGTKVSTKTPEMTITPTPMTTLPAEHVCQLGYLHYTCYNLTCPHWCHDLVHRELADSPELKLDTGLGATVATVASNCEESSVCMSGCFCPLGMLVDADGSCVKPDNCSCEITSASCDEW
ncbi:unnamed protein product [Protopolystoma xenopodis]|uniref:Spondin-like TSP1 domain-containing protein n=1 Tax=Protopolystoma xenopodis TaxID=117903 RepID=A0A3S5CF56_9PLAT|nr:unnamed protein product [Protopolystoma xenopodis]